MNDNKRIDIGFVLERGFHYIVLVFVFVLIVLSAGFVYMSVQAPKNIAPEVIQNEEGSVNVKPLPDFIVDTVPSDELESLKP